MLLRINDFLRIMTYMLKLTPARRNNRLTTVHWIDMKYKYFGEFEAIFVKDLLRN